MKKGQEIKVTDLAKYNGADMEWTETFTGLKTIGKGGEWVCHVSEKEVKEFLAKKICVTPSEHTETYFESNSTKEEVMKDYFKTKFLYCIFLAEGTVVETYSDDEYRFDLDETFKIVFSGKIHRAPGGMKIKNGRQVYFDLTFCDTINPENK
jgi:hypothetical protein